MIATLVSTTMQMITEPINYPTVGAVNDSQQSSDVKLRDRDNGE